MNLNEIKRELEEQLAGTENRLNELDRMAQQAFAGIKQRFDDDIEVMTNLFLNLTTHETKMRDILRSKLGVELAGPDFEFDEYPKPETIKLRKV